MPASQMLICSLGAAPPPPPPTLTDIIDTFTASNGTNPTSRDIDAYGGINGFKRWQLNYQSGTIQSNALAGGGAWIANSVLVANTYLEDSPLTNYTLPLPWMLLVDGLTVAPSPTSGVYTGYYVSATGDGGDVLLQVWDAAGGSGTLEFYYRIRNSTTSVNNYTENGGDGHYVTGYGPHKIGVFVDAGGVSVILNGSVLVTSTGGDGVYADFQHAEHEIDGSTTANTTLNRICPVLTTVADLTAAIALTV